MAFASAFSFEMRSEHTSCTTRPSSSTCAPSHSSSSFVTRPDVSEAPIDPLSLRPQESYVVVVRGIECADEKHTVVEAFRSLMH